MSLVLNFHVNFFHMKILLPGLLFFLAINACIEPPEVRYEKMAAGWCDCTAPMVELNEQAQKLMADRDTSAAHQLKIAEIFRKMEEAEIGATSCSTILRDKYGAVKTDEWLAAEPFFWKKCPKMLGQVEKLHGMLGE